MRHPGFAQCGEAGRAETGQQGCGSLTCPFTAARQASAEFRRITTKSTATIPAILLTCSLNINQDFARRLPTGHCTQVLQILARDKGTLVWKRTRFPVVCAVSRILWSLRTAKQSF
jgi:hypothetical protein